MELMEYPGSGDQDGMRATPGVFEAKDAGVYEDPTDGIVKVPDFSIHLA